MNAYQLINLFSKMGKKKETASERRVKKDRRVSTPPRSMTEAEQVYYNRNKNLNGFYK